MRLYLDLNCFNRPFNDQSYARIARETEAVFAILDRIISGADQLVWSSVLTFENSQHPVVDCRVEIGRWARIATVHVPVSEPVATRARELVAAGVDPMDAAHLACL